MSTHDETAPAPLDDDASAGYPEEHPADPEARGRPLMAPTPPLSLGSLAQQLAGTQPVLDPAQASPAELLACLPTDRCRQQALAAAAEAQASPAGTPRHVALARRSAVWASRVRLALHRDAELARRRLLGPAYSACTCLGQGGSGEQIVASLRAPDGQLLAVLDDQGRQVATWSEVCDCPDGQALGSAVARARRASAERYRARRVALIAGRAEIPRAYAGLTVASWAAAAEAAGASAASVAEVLDRIALWERITGGVDPQPRCLLLLAGNNGTGKSGLAAALAAQWVTQERSVLFRRSAQVTAALRAAPYRAANGEDDRPTEAALLAAYQECELLVLDDLGAENLDGPEGQRVRERLFAIIDGRLAECRPTIVTTNLPRVDLADGLGARLADRLGSPLLAVQTVLVGPNLRATETAW
jgi:hypothetical protein